MYVNHLRLITSIIKPTNPRIAAIGNPNPIIKPILVYPILKVVNIPITIPKMASFTDHLFIGDLFSLC